MSDSLINEINQLEAEYQLWFSAYYTGSRPQSECDSQMERISKLRETLVSKLNNELNVRKNA